jgi:hypothetical protein
MTKAQQKAQAVEHNRQLIEHAWKVGRDYGINIFSHSFRAWEDVAKFLNQNYPGEKTWTADSVRLLSYWYTADDGVVVRRPRKARGTGKVAAVSMAKKVGKQLKIKDPIFDVVATEMLAIYRGTKSPRQVAARLNASEVPAVQAYRKQRGDWTEARVDKLVRKCKRRRPDLYTRIVGEPAVIRKNKKSSQLQQAFALDAAKPKTKQVPMLTREYTDATDGVFTPAPVVQHHFANGDVVVARAGVTFTPAKPKTTRVQIQHDGDVLQVIQTPQKRLIISAKATEASGGKLVAAVAKLCQELGVDVSKW